jgi:hypothetical protein
MADSFSSEELLTARGWLALAAMALLTVGLAGTFWARHRTSTTEALAEAAAGNHRNCALEFHLSERHLMFFVGDVAQRDLTQFADVVVGPLVQQLSGV